MTPLTLMPGGGVPSARRELIVDSFAGGGGASLGIALALGRGPDIAINHDPEAIALHAANHPETRHYCESVWQVDPREATGGQPVGLMWLSPDCKHFSKAKGGKPVEKKVRGLAWVAVRWAKAVRPRVIVLENVEEFQTWGPLGENGRPCPRRRGRTFRMFTGRLRGLGYEVQWRELRASDYGAPTIRRRLFLVARCDGQPIVWPKPTHGRLAGAFAPPVRTAAECIDWSLPCPSIFDRPKPLAEATQRRIAAGFRKYVLESPRPFLVSYYGTKTPGGERTADVGQPLPTQPTENRFALVAPTLVQTGYGERAGQAPRALDLAKPLGTAVAGGQKHALVAAFLAKHYSERSGREVMAASLFDAAPTVTTVDHNALIETTLAAPEGDAAPIAADRREQVRAFLVAYYGNEADGQSLLDPVRTVTSRDRLGLVTVAGEDYVIADIGMRMLSPRELYRAQGFPDAYRIDVPFRGKPLSKTAQVRMVGNSVCPPLARAIVAANYAQPQPVAAPAPDASPRREVA